MTVQEAINAVITREPLFANMVTRLRLVEDNDNCPTMGTDGEHLFYNTNYLKTLKPSEMCGVVLHEIFHCAFQHQWRREKRHQMLWNIATDYAINTIVNEVFPLPKGALLDSKYYGMSAEDIYDSFDKPPKDKNGKGKGGKGDGTGQKEQGWCDHSSWEEGKDAKGKGIIGKIFGKARPKGQMTPEQRAKMWKDLHDQTFLKQYGKLPMSLQRVLAKTHFIPVIDWGPLVQKLLSTDESDYTFAVPDRRFMGEDYMLPSLLNEEKLKDVVFAYDTSASITKEDLTAYVTETKNLFHNFSTLQGYLAICDASLHHFSEISAEDGAEKFPFIGGGGTSFRPVFEEITRQGLSPKALFYFTDCEGSFPNEEPDYPVYWLVRSRAGNNYPIRVPFGTVIRFLEK